VFERVAHLAVGPTANVELCRVLEGEHSGQLIAVKRLRAAIADDADFVTMFRDEMWMAAALRHRNIARVLGWGEDERGLYLAVEFVRGVSLQRLMRTVFVTGEAFTERLVVYLAACVCSGLAAAHELRSPTGELLNLVHRDITTGNLLLGFDGEVKITDFGLAKAKQRATRTAVGITKGEPAYMSPEQVHGKPLDGRSDVFALGVVLYELFAQRRPWSVQTVREALEHIVEGDPPDLQELCPRLDRALVALVKRCMAKDPADRYPSAAELQDKLDEWLRLHGYDKSRHSLARFVRRNALKQMRWLERAIAGELSSSDESPFEQSRAEREASGLESPAKGSSEHTQSTAATVRASPQSHPNRQGPASLEPKSSESAPRTIPQERPPMLSDESMITTMRRPASPSETPASLSGRSATRQRDATPPLGAAGNQAIDFGEAPEIPQPPTVTYPGATHDPPTIRTRVRYPFGPPLAPVPPPSLPVPPADEPSSPVPLLVPAEPLDEPSAPSPEDPSEALERLARRIRATANALLSRAATASAEAERSARSAAGAEQIAKDMARRAELAAEAARLAGAAMRSVSRGDDIGAAEQLRRAQALHDAARE
jgi:serine/threonine-protein kinase